MDARPQLSRTSLGVAQIVLFTALLGGALPAQAARHRTTNFIVQAPSRALAQEIGKSAETWRAKLAVEWLGKEMPAWSKPCPIHAQVSPRLGAGGETSFVFDRGEVFGWTMKVQGSRERVLDSVLPHEITHTIFASHFRQPLPRWADEGACTTVEHPSEIGKQERMLIRFLKTGKGIPFDRLFAMKEYPPEVMPLYSQGHSLATFLIERRGKRAFLEFLADGMADENWPAAIRDHYGHQSLFALQDQWLTWVKQGRPRLAIEDSAVQVASAQTPVAPAPEPAMALAPPPRPAVEPQGSVYAAMAKSNETPIRTPSGGSVYDASRGERILRR